MKIKKSFLIGIFLLGVLSLGFVCAGDNSSLDNMQDDALGENAIGDSQNDVNKLSNSLKDNDSQSGESEDKEDLFIGIYAGGTIYPWTWADSDGDSGPGIDIYFEEYDTTGNTTVYLDDEVVYKHQGEFSHYLVDEVTLWQHYNGNGEHTVKVVYSGDDRYNPTTETCSFSLNAYYCNIEEDGSLFFELSSDVSGVLTVKANGRTILTKDIEATYHRYYIGYSSETYRFALDNLDSGVNRIEVSFTSDRYSFDESFEYYNNASKDTVPNQTDVNSTSEDAVINQPDVNSTVHKEVRAGNDSKISIKKETAGNPLLVLALVLSFAVLLPRKK